MNNRVRMGMGLEVLVNVLDLGANLQAATDMARFHHSQVPNTMTLESKSGAGRRPASQVRKVSTATPRAAAHSACDITQAGIGSRAAVKLIEASMVTMPWVFYRMKRMDGG
jgi:gamma-glutamyltranspeptidase